MPLCEHCHLQSPSPCQTPSQVQWCRNEGLTKFLERAPSYSSPVPLSRSVGVSVGEIGRDLRKLGDEAEDGRRLAAATIGALILGNLLLYSYSHALTPEILNAALQSFLAQAGIEDQPDYAGNTNYGWITP